LIFTIDKEEYGIQIKHVIEIIGIQTITPIPDLPPYVKGVINLRGKIIPVMDVRIRFKKPIREYDDRTCIIVIEIMDTLVGLVIDRVSEVINISEQEIAPPPQISNTNNKYIEGIGKVGNKVKLLLDCHKLLSEEEVSDITNAV